MSDSQSIDPLKEFTDLSERLVSKLIDAGLSDAEAHKSVYVGLAECNRRFGFHVQRINEIERISKRQTEFFAMKKDDDSWQR